MNVVGIYRFDVDRDGEKTTFEGTIKEFDAFHKKKFGSMYYVRDKHITRTLLREEKKEPETYMTYTLVSEGKTVRARTMEQARKAFKIGQMEEFKNMINDDEIIIHRVDKKTEKKNREFPKWYQKNHVVLRGERSDSKKKRVLNRYYLERATAIELSNMEDPE